MITSDGYLPPLIDPHADKVAFLAANGYFQGDFPDSAKLQETDTLFQAATMEFQELADIVPDGVFGPVSQSRAAEKRCALPDLNRGFVLEEGQWVEWAVEEACTRKWSTKTLTCTHDRMSFSTLSRAETDKAWWEAKQSWMKVCGITFKRKSWNGPRSANFYHMTKNIDGRSGTLAYHFLPNCNQSSRSALEGRFDVGERWTPTFFQAVCAHEDGHGLGLHHDTSKDALLYPYYQRHIVEPTRRDAARVVKLYGRPNNQPDDPTPQPPQPPKPNPTPSDLEQRVLQNELSIEVNRALLDTLLRRG